MYPKLIIFFSLCLLFANCSEKPQFLHTWKNIEYIHTFSEICNYTIDHFVYVKNVESLDIENIEKFCIFYARQSTKVNGITLVKTYHSSGEDLASEDIVYNIWIERNGDSIFIKSLEKY